MKLMEDQTIPNGIDREMRDTWICHFQTHFILHERISSASFPV
jgi:hypothetical protein